MQYIKQLSQKKWDKVNMHLLIWFFSVFFGISQGSILCLLIETVYAINQFADNLLLFFITDIAKTSIYKWMYL